jgi:plastocyanin
VRPRQPPPASAANYRQRQLPTAPSVSSGDTTFTPPVITVPAGATVVWSHGGQRPHTITADDDSFGTDVLKTGATFQQTFNQAGT